MAKKFAKTLVGIGAAAVAGKVAYDKYKTVKEAFTKEENESVDAEVKKEQEKNSRTISVEDRAAQLNDIVTIDFEGSVDGVPFDGF